MASERMTITLPSKTAKRMRDKARKTGKPLSRVIAEELDERDRAREDAQLAADYRAAAEEAETRRVTAELEESAREVLSGD